MLFTAVNHYLMDLLGSENKNRHSMSMINTASSNRRGGETWTKEMRF